MQNIRWVLLSIFSFIFVFNYSLCAETSLSSPQAILNDIMSLKPYGALNGNCLGGCKGGLVGAKYLPSTCLRAHSENPIDESQYRHSHEGIFSDDLFTRPFAFEPLFKELNINEEEYNDMFCTIYSYNDGNIPSEKILSIRKNIYSLILNALNLPREIITEELLASDRDSARKIFYISVTNYLRQNENRNLEFWFSGDKIIYNLIFGEFNYAWLAMLDIFESPKLNPDHSKFKRIFPSHPEELGSAIYTPNKVGPEGSLMIDPLDPKQVPDNAIIIYRLGSCFTQGIIHECEMNWSSPENDIEELWEIDSKPGHIEIVTPIEKKKSKTKETERFFASDGKLPKPATEWQSDREIIAIYVPTF